MDSLLRIIATIVVMIQVILAKDIPVSSNYVLRHTDSCPEAGYYYRREHAINVAVPAPCYICICQKKNTAACWLRESSHCDVELFHKTNKRVQRSTLGLQKLFLDDAFKKQLTKQCKPYQSTYDGCPPADWCRGCTVCDCDVNGRWKCHIVSFCNKDEKNKKKDRKFPLTEMPRRTYQQNQSKLGSKNNVTTMPNYVVLANPKKLVKSMLTHQIKHKKQYNNAGKSKNNDVKLNDKSNNSKTNKHKRRPKLPLLQRNMTKKHERKRKMIQKKTIKNKKLKKTRALKNKLTNKRVNVAIQEPQGIDFMQSTGSKIMNIYVQSKLKRRIINRVQENISKEMLDLQNTTKARRSTDSQNENNEMTDKKLMNYNLRQSKLKSYKKQYNYRKKRETFDMDLSIIDLKDARSFEKALIDNSTKQKDFANITTEKVATTKKLLILNSTVDNIMYYKYSIEKNSSDVTTNTVSIPTKVETNITSSVVTDKVENKTETIMERAIKKGFFMIDPEFYDLKYKKWERMKILRNNITDMKINRVLKFDKNNRKINDSLIKRLHNKKHAKGIERKLGFTNKHNLMKIITNNFATTPINFLSRQSTATYTKKNYNIRLQSLLDNLINELNENTTKSIKLKIQFSLFKYLRNIFRNLFPRKEGNLLKQSDKINEGHTLEILCENIGACYMNKHNRKALRSKIHNLNTETEKIFKLVKSIKGLLNLIEMPVNQENNTKISLNEDIKKLDAILKDMYTTDEDSSLIQKAHINNIKDNIQQFIKSVGRFASILNEIIDILYKNKTKWQRNSRLGQKKKLNSFNKIKNLLLKYNIVQNKFMKKMYQLLTYVEKNVTTKYPKLKNIEINDTQVIDRYSKNIMEKLSRLKSLAHALNSSRRKRQTMREDNAIEYLLMLMECLMNQNHLLKKTPVNDGIDLLIEAIQNAPNVKQVEKKVIDSVPTTTTASRINSIVFKYSKEDSISDSDRISKEENNSYSNENNLLINQAADNIDKITHTVFDNRFNNTTVFNKYDTTTDYAIKTKIVTAKTDKHIERTGFDKLSKEENNLSDSENNLVIEQIDDDEDKIPQLVYYNKFDGTQVFNKSDTETENEDQKKNVSQDKSKEQEKTVLGIIKNTFNNTKQYELYSSDLENEEIPVVKSSTTKQLPIPVTSYAILPLQDYKLDDDLVDNKITKLDWTEENLDTELKEYGSVSFDYVSTTTTPANSQNNSKSIDQSISSITETLEQEDKNKKSTVAADEVMHRKQAQFLKSLDYGTERSEFDGSESKDEEKNFGFPAYFSK